MLIWSKVLVLVQGVELLSELDEPGPEESYCPVWFGTRWVEVDSLLISSTKKSLTNQNESPQAIESFSTDPDKTSYYRNGWDQEVKQKKEEDMVFLTAFKLVIWLGLEWVKV